MQRRRAFTWAVTTCERREGARVVLEWAMRGKVEVGIPKSELEKAAAAVALFAAMPSVPGARSAQAAVRSWAGPMPRQAVADVARALSPLALTQLLQTALTLYVAEHTPEERL